MNSTNTSRTAHLLELMKKGDDAFNSRDVAAMNAAHHPDIIAHVMGIPDPILGRVAHAAMIQQMIRMFPDIHVHNDPYPIQLGSGDWITVITRATGTFTGEMIMPEGKVIAPTGKSFDLEFATTAKWEGDLLLEEFVFVDSALRARLVWAKPSIWHSARQNRRHATRSFRHVSRTGLCRDKHRRLQDEDSSDRRDRQRWCRSRERVAEP
jgi:ketosteroid isomerase-like protein